MDNPAKQDHGASPVIPVIDLSSAPGERAAWDRPRFIIYLWAIAELLFVTNPWQISSGLRVTILRLFGAEVGNGVIFRPRTRVKFPWKLHIGNNSWIGEGVWIHNQDHLYVDHDVVISQETFITTGSHSVRRDMALITRPIHIEAGAWVTARCILLGGCRLGRSCVITPNTVVKSGQTVAPGTIFGQPEGTEIGTRFPEGLYTMGKRFE